LGTKEGLKSEASPSLPEVKTMHAFCNAQAFEQQLAVFLLSGGFPDVVAGGGATPGMVEATEGEEGPGCGRHIL